MALVSGQTVSSFAEPYTDVCAAEDSDDEYVYVSSLAEQIAHALMLDDDDDPPSCNSSQHRFREDKAEQLKSKNADVMCPVSHFAAAWRDNGPTEWDCFYTPSPHHASMYTTQLEHSSKHCHMFRGWNSACLSNNKQVAAVSHETWDLRSQKSHSTAYIISSPARKESIGTGVFLPKIVNSGSHYRRKAGFSSSKSAYAPRHKC